mmetsp:Transcript_2085/g.7054  ORF Transcript_2085/g.7054 Transcript_2085/m.7054 type:complete len:200 (-) Transcript_2085:152-751(-)
MADDAISEAQLVIINGCWCANVALYPSVPQCIGCSVKVESCAVLAHCCCKCGTPGLSCRAFGDAAFVQAGLPCVAVGCKYPTTCIKTQAQLLFLAYSCALPGDREIPSACALCFLTCYPRVACCLRLTEARFKGGNSSFIGGPSAPDADGLDETGIDQGGDDRRHTAVDVPAFEDGGGETRESPTAAPPEAHDMVERTG